MELKAFPIFVKQIEDRVVKQIFAVLGNIDDGRDLMWPGCFTKTLSERSDRVRVLWQHDVMDPPIGVPQVLTEIGRLELPQDVLARYPSASGALYGEIKYLDTPRGNEVLVGIQEGAIRENSIGYEPVTGKFDFETIEGAPVRNLREVKLWDVSPVNWGMNPATRNLKTTVPYRDTGIAAEDVEWSAPSLGDFADQAWGDLSDDDVKGISSHFAWSANAPAGSFGDLKLPHHQPAKGDVGKAVWAGVQAAMGALMGAPGGVKIPDADRRAVYDHLAKHFVQFGKRPPDFKFVETCYAATEIAVLAEELKAGRMFSAANIEKLTAAMESMQQALGIMQEMIDAAEPQGDGTNSNGKAYMIPVAVLQQRARAVELMLRMAQP